MPREHPRELLPPLPHLLPQLKLPPSRLPRDPSRNPLPRDPPRRPALPREDEQTSLNDILSMCDLFNKNETISLSLHSTSLSLLSFSISLFKEFYFLSYFDSKGSDLKHSPLTITSMSCGNRYKSECGLSEDAGIGGKILIYNKQSLIDFRNHL